MTLATRPAIWRTSCSEGQEEVEYYTPSENLIIFADDVDAYCEQYGIDLSSVD